jgi:SAM-dependent methyltransferase
MKLCTKQCMVQSEAMTRNVADFDPTNRFTDRVGDYVRYRPRYPATILDTLRRDTGLTPVSVVADIGSGTGFSAEMFLENCNRVWGVEPNSAMRAAGATYLAKHPRFTAVAGTAEATTLPDASVDYVVAGQAFHWFERDPTRTEWARILRPTGWVALFWNSRHLDLSPFMAEYEALVHSVAPDYQRVSHEHVANHQLASMFADGAFSYHTFPYSQLLDNAGLAGRTFSSSYAPHAADARAPALRAALADLFARYEHEGYVQYDYTTELYFGRIARDAHVSP